MLRKVTITGLVLVFLFVGSLVQVAGAKKKAPNRTNMAGDNNQNHSVRLRGSKKNKGQKGNRARLKGQLKSAVAGDNAFALDLYSQLSNQDKTDEVQSNLFFSPYSISTALAMTYAGAKGQTAQQMASVLHFNNMQPSELSVILGSLQRKLNGGGKAHLQKQKGLRGKNGHKSNRQKKNKGKNEGKSAGQGKARHKNKKADNANSFELSQAVPGASASTGKNKAKATRGYELAVANALWGQKGFKFLPEYLKLIKHSYHAGLNELDFAKQTERARNRINKWVEKKTNGKIKNLIGQGVLNAMTRLVLTNAIYFKGQWACAFNPKTTREMPFHISDTKTVPAKMMYQQHSFKYTNRDGVQILELPYKGNKLSMVVLLPKQGELTRLENMMSAQQLQDWINALTMQEEVRVYLPRFKMTQQFSLGDVLKAMGMKDAFSRDADFSGMTGKKDLYISAVVHKAFVEVNEEGTEAAAATGVVMTLKSAMPARRIPVFRADRPFIFIIRDNVSGSILFMGRVVTISNET